MLLHSLVTSLDMTMMHL